MNITEKGRKHVTPNVPVKQKPLPFKYNICEYCTNEKQLETEYSCALTTIRISENIMTIYDYEMDADGYKINYCPMCGRKLEEER